MLRASAQVNQIDIDPRAIGDRRRAVGRDDAAALLAFTDALVGRTDDLDSARRSVADVMGGRALAPAAAAAGNFEMMNRILDATGVPVPASMWELGPHLGLSPEEGGRG